MNKRTIFKDSVHCGKEVRDLLQSLFAIELISPSDKFWLVSAWITDIPVLDNSALSFNSVSPHWKATNITLSEVLIQLARQGTEIIIATNNDLHNTSFKQRLTDRSLDALVSEKIHILSEENDHSKSIVADSYYLNGSMNFTQNGISVNGETITLELEPDSVNRMRVQFSEKYNPESSS